MRLLDLIAEKDYNLSAEGNPATPSYVYKLTNMREWRNSRRTLLNEKDDCNIGYW